MSDLFALDVNGQRALEEEARLNPLKLEDLPAPMWQGAGEAGKGLLRPAAGAGRTLLIAGATFPMLLDKTDELANLAAGATKRRAELGLGPTRLGAAEWYFRNVVDDTANDAVDYWTPNAEEMGSAAKALNVGSNVVGAVPLMVGTPGLFVASSGADPAAEIVRQGGDVRTAATVGGINLAATAVGMRLPAAWGSTLTTRLLTGSGANLALGLTTDAASSAVLRAAGMEEMAAGFDWSDPYARSLDLLMGLAFGGAAHVSAPKAPTTMRDAVLTARNDDHAVRQVLPGEPINAAAERGNRTAMSTAIDQVLRGEQVNLADTLRLEDFVLRPELQSPAQRVQSSGREAVQRDFRAIAERHGATITSMERPVISRGAGARSQHPHGTAADFRTRDKTPEQVEALMADLRRSGFEVVDERNTDQPHIHAELPPGGRRAQNIANAAAETNEAGIALRERLVNDPAQLARDYAAIKDSKGGTVLNTDVARELSPEYLADRTRSADVHEAASDTIKTIYAEKLSQPTPEGFENRVLFTAGGTGAGKTTAIGAVGEGFGRPEIVYDTNMNRVASSVEKIEQALAAGRNVQIAYVYRDPVEALTGGAIQRAQRQAKKFGTGRTVPLEEHARTHEGVRPTMEALMQRYADDPRVFFSFIDNSRGEGNSTLVASLADVPKWADNNLRERLQAALEEARAAGLDESLYQGFRADGRQAADVPAARNADRAGDGGRPEPGDRGEVTAAAQPETAIDAATRLTSETPDLNVYLDENGPPISLADAMSEIEAERQRATRDADGYTAAANCFLRNGDA